MPSDSEHYVNVQAQINRLHHQDTDVRQHAIFITLQNLYSPDKFGQIWNCSFLILDGGDFELDFTCLANNMMVCLHRHFFILSLLPVLTSVGLSHLQKSVKIYMEGLSYTKQLRIPETSFKIILQKGVNWCYLMLTIYLF